MTTSRGRWSPSRLFRRFELNAVGWAALLGAGLVVAILLTFLGAPALFAVFVGEAAVLFAVVARDRWTWRAERVYLCFDESPEVVHAAVRSLQAQGYRVDYTELWRDADAERGWVPAVLTREADRRKVAAALQQRAR